MIKVLDSYQRFDQKNNMMMRPVWDAKMKHIGPATMETRERQIKGNVKGFELRDFALATSSTLLGSALGTNINQPDGGLTSWDAIPISKYMQLPKCELLDDKPETLTRQVKRVARHLGADLVGVAELDMRWVYSHHYITETKESKPVEIDDRYKNVIAMGMEMDYDLVNSAPNALHQAVVSHTYSKMAFLVAGVAQFIRSLGYSAIPSINDTALNVPIAIDAGLGELGRQGVLITPHFGPRQRLCKVITDMPLTHDHPIEFGVRQFCDSCKKCALHCPSGAVWDKDATTEVTGISNNPGVLKWPMAVEKCREYFSKTGTNCGICIRVCPFNKENTWFHQSTRWVIERTPWMTPFYVWMDDFFGYGKKKKNDTQLFWGDPT